MLETLNTIACTVMLVYLLYAAWKMPGGLHMPLHKLAVWFLSSMLGFQCAAPFSDEISQPIWHGQLLHVAFAVLLLVWRKEALAFIACKFTAKPRVPRQSDLPYLAPDEMAKVRGRGRS